MGAHIKPDQLIAFPYKKNNPDQVSMNNNLYVKHIPDTWS